MIIGGGVIGVEMASVYASLGKEVTIIEAAERILLSQLMNHIVFALMYFGKIIAALAQFQTQRFPFSGLPV